MSKLTKLKITEAPPKSRLAIFRQEWYRKWNRVCATIVCILGFSLLLAIVINGNKKGPCDPAGYLTSRMIDSQADSKNCQKSANCGVFCKNVKSDVLSESINNVYDIQICRRIKSLKLIGIEFPNDTLYSSQFKLDRNVNDLSFETCSLKNVEARAFDKQEFDNLNSLTFTKVQLLNLQGNAFAGLGKLNELNIRENQKTMNFAADVLDYLTSLTTLQIENSLVADNLRNLTGTNVPFGLKSITFRYNKLLTSLPSCALRARHLETLYITNNGLKSIHDETFDELQSLKSLYLNDNQLTTLSGRSMKFLPNVRVYMAGNLWKCDCQLMWLQEIDVVDSNEVRCDTPMIQFDKFDFCNSSSSTSSTDGQDTNNITGKHTYASTEASTEYPNELNVECSSKTKKYMDSISFNRTIFISAQELSDGSVSVSLAGQNPKQTVFWMDSDPDSQKYGCESTTDYKIKLKEVEPSKSYIICGINRRFVSPLNCVALTTMPPDKNRTWLEKRYALPVILGATFFLLFVIVFTACFVYICLRKHPYLIQKRKDSNASGLSNGTSMIPDTTSIPIYIKKVVKPSDKAFTRKSEDYMSPISTITSFRSRSSSECGTYRSTTASYVVIEQPAEEFMTTWKVYSKTRKPVMPLFERGPSLPPPLPPPRRKPMFDLVRDGF